MQIDIHIDEERVYSAMDKAEQALREEWFNNDKEAYEDWAGDRISSVLWSFIETLSENCGICIDPCSK